MVPAMSATNRRHLGMALMILPGMNITAAVTIAVMAAITVAVMITAAAANSHPSFTSPAPCGSRALKQGGGS
jgi:hypothetical protein